jgi:hypothetical protein
MVPRKGSRTRRFNRRRSHQAIDRGGLGGSSDVEHPQRDLEELSDRCRRLNFCPTAGRFTRVLDPPLLQVLFNQLLDVCVLRDAQERGHDRSVSIDVRG